MITRAQYMADSENLHESYYGQFVTPQIKNMVIAAFGIDRLKRELKMDKNLNTIPLSLWDSLAGNYIAPNGGYASTLCAKELKAAGDGPSWSGGVCILKAAARMAVKES
jgi:hypothetical protein